MRGRREALGLAAWAGRRPVQSAGRAVDPDAAARFTRILDGLARLHRSVQEYGREEEQ